MAGNEQAASPNRKDQEGDPAGDVSLGTSFKVSKAHTIRR